MQTPFFLVATISILCSCLLELIMWGWNYFSIIIKKKTTAKVRGLSPMRYLLLLTSIKAADKQNSSIVAGVLSQKHLSYNPQKVMQLAFGNKYFASYQQFWGVFPSVHIHSTARYSFFFKPLLYNRLQKTISEQRDQDAISCFGTTTFNIITFNPVPSY